MIAIATYPLTKISKHRSWKVSEYQSGKAWEREHDASCFPDRASVLQRVTGPVLTRTPFHFYPAITFTYKNTKTQNITYPYLLQTEICKTTISLIQNYKKLQRATRLVQTRTQIHFYTSTFTKWKKSRFHGKTVLFDATNPDP